MTAAILTRSCSFLCGPRRSGDSASGISFLRRTRSVLLPLRSRCAAALHYEAEVAREGRLLRRARSEGDLVPSNRPGQVDLQANWFDSESRFRRFRRWSKWRVPAGGLARGGSSAGGGAAAEAAIRTTTGRLQSITSGCYGPTLRARSS
ncbi:unnamed protein product [Musa textilis]